MQAMKTTIYDYVIECLQATKGSWPDVARGAGMSLRSIEKIARREIADPGVSKVQKLHDYFAAESRKRKSNLPRP